MKIPALLFTALFFVACGGGTTTIGQITPGDDAGGEPGGGPDGGVGLPVDRLHVTSISAGGTHTCARLSNGAVKCWGQNDHGQLGDGTRVSSATPVLVKSLPPVKTVVASSPNTCAILETGDVACWGWNSHGQVGNGTKDDQVLPVNVNGLSDIVGLSMTGEAACALSASGGVRCWGFNAEGRVGDGTTVDALLPVPVVGLASGVKAIASGGGRSCALLPDGAMTCWGLNDVGQIGDGTTSNALAPVAVLPSGSGATAISLGWRHSCLFVSGSVKCRGYNGWGVLGDGTWDDKWSWADTSDVTALGSDAAQISMTLYHSCAIRKTGGLVCWGGSNWGQRGDGTTVTLPSPQPVVGLAAGVKEVSAGGGTTCALMTSGEVKCWGNNGEGQLGAVTTETCGDEKVTCATKPVTVPGIL